MSTYTAEGAKSGDLAAKLAAQREAERAEFERRKAALTSSKPVISDDKFASTKATSAEEHFKAKTIGLVTVEQFKQAREAADAAAAAAAAGVGPAPSTSAAPSTKVSAGDKRKRAVLSFAGDDDEEDDDSRPAVRPGSSSNGAARAASSLATTGNGVAAASEPGAPRSALPLKLGKDPTVATDFLPDAERERRDAELREQLRKEWLATQEDVKKEKLEIVYSYWDGTGHRRTITVTKGTSVGKVRRPADEGLESYLRLPRDSDDNVDWHRLSLIPLIFCPHPFPVCALSFWSLCVRTCCPPSTS